VGWAWQDVNALSACVWAQDRVCVQPGSESFWANVQEIAKKSRETWARRQGHQPTKMSGKKEFI